MKRIITLITVLSLLFSICVPATVSVQAADAEPTKLAVSAALPGYKLEGNPYEERALDLVSRMTLAEKASQAAGYDSPAIPRLGVHTYMWWNEALHGYNQRGWFGMQTDGSSYPSSYSIGASWDADLYYKEAEEIGKEIRERVDDNAYNLTMFSPNINLARDPRWGRNDESYGEDPLLVGTLASCFVNGVEGKSQDGTTYKLTNANGEGMKQAGTTIKHYAANNSEKNRYTSGADDVTVREMREYYTRASRIVIEKADVSSVMMAYSSVSGIPISFSSYYMDTILRQSYGFSGYIVSDCDSIATSYNRNVHKNNPHTGANYTKGQAYANALANGLDLQCNAGETDSLGSYGENYQSMLGERTDKGTFTEAQFEVSAARLMYKRMQLGEFDADNKYAKIGAAGLAAGNAGEYVNGATGQTQKRIDLADEVSRSTIVLLKNEDGALPVTAKEINAAADTYDVAIVGSNAQSEFLGGYSSNMGTNGKKNVVTIEKAIRTAFADADYLGADAVAKTAVSYYADANSVPQALDLAIVVVGEGQGDSREDGDRMNINMKAAQLTMFEGVLAKNPKKLIVVMETYGAIQMPDTVLDNADAILWSGFNGFRKGTGFGEAITGKNNPSGRMNATWLKDAINDMPDFFSYTIFPDEEGNGGRSYMYNVEETLWPFGYGLSYSDVAYAPVAGKTSILGAAKKGDLVINEVTKDTVLDVTFQIKNTNNVAGRQVAEVYAVSPDAGKNNLPLKRLVGFDKVEVAANGTTTVNIPVKATDLAFFNEDADCYEMLPGKWQIWVAMSSEFNEKTDLCEEFTVVNKAIREDPKVVTVKPTMPSDEAKGIGERVIFPLSADKSENVIIPNVGVTMTNEKLYGVRVINNVPGKDIGVDAKAVRDYTLGTADGFTVPDTAKNVARLEAGKTADKLPMIGTKFMLPDSYKIDFTSSRPTVVAVEGGKLVMKAPGTATITAKVTGPSGASAETEFAVCVTGDASVTGLSVGGNEVQDFDASVYNYFVDVPAGLSAKDAAATVTAQAVEGAKIEYSTDGKRFSASASGINPATMPGVVYVKVSGEGIAEVIYTITFGDYDNGCEHTYAINAIVEPTCTTDGYTSYVCTKCYRMMKDDIVPALGHTYEKGRCIRDHAIDPAIRGRNEDYVLASAAESGKQYVVVGKTDSGSFALVNAGTQILADKVTIKDGKIVSTVLEDMIWNVTANTAAAGTYFISTFDDSARLHHATASGGGFFGGGSTGPVALSAASGANAADKWTIAALGNGTVSISDVVTSSGWFSTTTYYVPSYTADGAIFKAANATSNGDALISANPFELYEVTAKAECQHDYTKVVTAPTCTEKGFTTYTCSKCGNTYTADEVAALGHDYKNGVCTRCGEKDPNYTPDVPTGASYVLADEIEAGKQYVIVGNGYALTNKTATVSTAPATSLGATAVTVEDDKITSTVTDDMIWDFAEGKSAVCGDYNVGFYITNGDSKLLTRGSSQGKSVAPLNTTTYDAASIGSKDYYGYWIIRDQGNGNKAMFLFSNANTSEYVFALRGAAEGFDAPGQSQSNIDSLLSANIVKLYEVVSGGAAPESVSIDFTNPDDASKFEIAYKDTAAIAAGTGLKLVATKNAFEDCVGQLSGDAATTPKDVVEVPVSGNWTATLQVAFDTNGAANGYYQFFGFYASEGDDYQKMAGIRGGDGAMQNFLRKDGSLVADSTELDSAPGFDTNKIYWFQIVKEGTTYTCYRSNDGEAFDEMFAYEDTGIEATKLIMDAYTGMTENYAFTLKTLDIAGSGATVCQHEYVSVVTAPTCTDKGYTTMTCSKCGKVRIVDEKPALRHNFVDGFCTRCGIEEPDIDPTIPIFENPQYTFEERAADLVARLTPAQKGNQVTSVAPAISASQLGGGALNVPATKNLNAYHWWSECLHGYSANISGSGDTGNAISYTQNTAVGNSWNPELYYQEATMISDEIRERAMKNSQTGNCIDLNFYSPTVNMHRDPRWGRNEESFSEDVLLNSTMASAFVNGIEGKDMDGNLLDPDGYLKAMCTVKHYVANNSERNRLNGGAQTSLRALREYYTAPYRNVIRNADVTSVMTAYSTLNGEPSSYSSYLMDTLLRQTFGLSGHITSDCDSVATETRHAYRNPFTGETMTDLEALAGSLAHGEDLECTGGYSGFGTYGSKMTRILEAAPETDKGIFTENSLDISVWRLMKARIATGEFDEGLRYTQEASARISAGNRNEARLAMNDEMNKESVVLLQNKGVLPLNIPKTGSDYELVIVGEWQTNSYRGLYTAGGNNSVYNIQSGIRDAVQRVNPNVKLTYITSNSLTDANKATISGANAVIVVTGTPENYSKEDGDRTSTVLPNNLEGLISSVGKLNPNSVVIMETCGPMRVKTFQNDVNAILWNSFGGLRKGAGFGAVITGEVNPSGKVTDTWYQNVSDSGESDIPSIYDYDLFPSEGKNGRTYMYYNGENAPSYPFGYGLSYTTFAYSNLKLDKTSYDANETVKVTFDVKNTGKVAGKEVTELYIAQPDAPAALKRPIRRLEGFDKIELQPGETKTVSMEVAIPDLAFFNEEKDCYAVDTGKYQVQVGTNSAEANLTKDFTVTGEMDEYPVLLTVKANQKGDSENGIEQRLIYDRNTYVNPQLTVAMNNEKLYGYIIANQQSPIKQLKSCDLPKGMTFTYESNRPSVAKVEADGRIKTVGAGVATITVTGKLDDHVVTADFVVYVMGNSYLSDITLDGKPLSGYKHDKHGYELNAADFAKAPVVDVINDDPDLKVTVTQFTGIPGYATVTAVCEATNQSDTYRIGIGGAPAATDFAKGWADAQKKNWTVVNGDSKASFGADGLTIAGQAGSIAAGSAKNLYAQPAFGEWVAQTNIKLAAAPTSGQQAGMFVMDDAKNNVQFVYENGKLTAYSYVDGARTQIGSASIGSVTAVSLQSVKQGSVYTFRYSVDGENWTDLSGKATVEMGYPQLGVVATGDGISATFDGIDVFKVTDLYPRLSSISVDGKPLGEFDPEVFIYSCEVASDATKAPVVTAKAADDDLRVVIEQAKEPVGTATVSVYSSASSASYTLNFNRGPESDYFADGGMNPELWEVLRENKGTYDLAKGKGLVLPTQANDIYSTGAAWENVFVEPGMGNWVVVAKMVYPKVPTADYQQAMFLVWEDEDNYIRMNCQQSQLRMEPGVEAGGSFNGNLGSGNATAAADGTVTIYFMIEKLGNDYTVGYSQNGTAFETLGTARNIAYTNPKVGLFATQNSSSTPIDAYFEYVYVAARNGLRPNYEGMLTWAAQNAADYIAADLPGEATDKLTLSDAPHGYTVTLNSSDESVIAPDGTVTVGASDKVVKVSVTVTEGAISATSEEVAIKVPGTAGPCVHDYKAVVTKPTCTEKGFTTYTCAKCGDSYTGDEVAALGHDYKAIVTKPTCTEAGYTTYTCDRCGDSYKADEVAALEHDFKDGKCTRCGEKDPDYKEDPLAKFTDLKGVDWALDGIRYCVENGLMKGMTDTTFGPQRNLTRGQFVTILYRVAGAPETTFEKKFDDVEAGRFYSEAVVWAAEKGYVKGVSETKFDPEGDITREQIAAILYRYAAPSEIKGDLEAFPDKAEVSNYAREAMAWAVGEGIINGTKTENGNMLAPKDNATRAQIATIFMRWQKDSEE